MNSNPIFVLSDHNAGPDQMDGETSSDVNGTGSVTLKRFRGGNRDRRLLEAGRDPSGVKKSARREYCEALITLFTSLVSHLMIG